MPEHLCDKSSCTRTLDSAPFFEKLNNEHTSLGPMKMFFTTTLCIINDEPDVSFLFAPVLKKRLFFIILSLQRDRKKSNNLNVSPSFSKAKLCFINTRNCFRHFRSAMKQRMSVSMSFSSAIHFSALMTTELLKTACVDLFLESAWILT